MISAPYASPDGAGLHGGVQLVTVLVARILRYLASDPGAGTTDVKHGARISGYAQAWRVLTRLERQGMVASRRDGNAKTWTLTPHGNAVLEDLPEGVYV